MTNALKKRPLPSQEYLKSRLDYDPITGIFTWKPRPVAQAWEKTWNTRYAGKRAGNIFKCKFGVYRQIGVDDVTFLEHRLAMAISGFESLEQIDHINGDGLDNRLCNLRNASAQQNRFNQKLIDRNTSGFKGVSYLKKLNKWRARVTVNRREHHLGVFQTIEEAIRAVEIGREKLHGEFARHQ